MSHCILSTTVFVGVIFCITLALTIAMLLCFCICHCWCIRDMGWGHALGTQCTASLMCVYVHMCVCVWTTSDM